MKRARLARIKPLAGQCMQLVFVDGSEFTVDFAPLIAASPGLAPLRDARVFAKAQLLPGEGWAVHWVEPDIQVGADTLWLDAKAQTAPDEDTRTFIEWRARHGLSLAQAAKALGMTARTVSAYGRGERAVPRYIALACKGWEAETGAAAHANRAVAQRRRQITQ